VTTRRALRAVLLLVAAGLPGADARAGGLQLRAGVSYWRSDAWSEGGTRSTAPHLDVDLGLDARGVLVSREWVSYRLDAQLRRITDERDGVETGSTQTITFNANANVLNNGVSPIALSLFGSRSEVDFAADPLEDVHGSGLTTAAGAQLTLSLLNKPALMASYSVFETEQSIPGQSLFQSTVHSLGSSVGFGTAAFQVQASYSGQLQDSVWAADDFATHDVAVSAWVPVGTATLSLESISAFSAPEELVLGAVEQQTSTFRATWNNGAPLGRRHIVTYSYGHALRESLGADVAEATRQGASYQGDVSLSGSTLFARWLVDASLGEERSGTTAVKSTGETLGLEGWWRHTSGVTTYELRAGPRVGLRQSDEENTSGFGVTARAQARRPLWGHSLSFDWNGSYSTELFATAGWQYSHSLAASLSGRAGSTAFDAALRGSSFRTSSPVTGAGAGRRLDASARANMTRLQLDARVGFHSGMVGATPDQFVGDGLILPAPFDSNVFDASVGAAWRFSWGLSGHARARFNSSDVPGRPTLEQGEAILGFTYQYGAFGLGLEDRIVRYEQAAGGWNTGNVVMVRAHRTLVW
jgi:hypothetical protein